jgi:hypothetical protein
VAVFSDIQTRLSNLVARTDSDFTNNQNDLINRALRWIERQIVAEAGTVKLLGTFNTVPGVPGVTTPPAQQVLNPVHRLSKHSKLYYQNNVASPPTKTEIVRIPPAFLRTMFFDQNLQVFVDPNSTTFGPPIYWSLTERTFNILPVSDIAYTVEEWGVQFLSALVNASDTNYLLVEAEDALLYAAAMETWLFFEDKGRAMFYRDRAVDSIEQWKNDREGQETESFPLVMEAPGGTGARVNINVGPN